jgi:hypothetical protein
LLQTKFSDVTKPFSIAPPQETILAVTFFAAISNDNLGSVVRNLMKDSMKNFDERHKDHGVTKGLNFVHT